MSEADPNEPVATGRCRGVHFVRLASYLGGRTTRARLAARAHALSQRWCQGSPFHSLTAIQTASQPKKNPRLRNGWSDELTNGMEASHTVIQTAMVTQPRQSTGRLPPKTGLGPNQYRGLSSEVLRVECSLDLAVRVMPDNVAGDELPGDLRDSNHACLLFGSE